jgi:hypothetical protein
MAISDDEDVAAIVQMEKVEGNGRIAFMVEGFFAEGGAESPDFGGCGDR